MTKSVTTEQFKAAMGSFAAGVTVVTTLDSAGNPQALTATAFCSLSKQPPLCLVCIDRQARAHASLLELRRFVVNILSASQSALSTRFAETIDDKFSGVAWRAGAATGCPIIGGALVWLECELVIVHDGGDHDILVGRLVDAAVHEGEPLIYFRGSYMALAGPGLDQQHAVARGDK